MGGVRGGSGSVAQTGEGSLPQSPGQHYWDMGFGVRKIQDHILHFLLTGSVALSIHAVCLCFSFLICKMGMLTSTSQGCRERKTSPSADSAVMPKLHKE